MPKWTPPPDDAAAVADKFVAPVDVATLAGNDVHDGDDVDVENSASDACESNEENFGERFMRAVPALLVSYDEALVGTAGDAVSALVGLLYMDVALLLGILGRAPVERCCGSDVAAPAAVVCATGTAADDNDAVGGVVMVEVTAAVVVNGLRLRKCLSEKGVSSRLTGSAVAVVMVSGSSV